MSNVISEFGTILSGAQGTPGQNGANCVITNITPITGGNRVTFQWTDNDGTIRTETMDVMDGTQGSQGDAGRGIQSASIDGQEHLIITYDDGTTQDAGKMPGGAVIDDTTPAVNKVFSSEKTSELISNCEPTIESSIFTELGRYSIGSNVSTGTQNGCCYDSATHKFYYTQKVSGILHIYEVDFTDAAHPTLSRDCVTTLDTITVPVGGLTGTGVCILGNYLFASYRSSEPNVPSTGMNNDDIWGALVCVELTNFTEVWVKTFNAKCSCVRTHVSGSKIYLALSCQMSYIQFYSVDPSDYSQITLEDTQYFVAYNTVSGWTDYLPNVQECQQGCFYETEDHRVLYVAAGFGDGVHIFDITDVQSGVKRATLYNWSVLSNAPDWWKIQNMTHHTFDCVVNYPYVYATMAGDSSMCNYEIEHGVTLRNNGIVVLNISDLEHITANCFPMSKSDLCTFSGGDPKPNTIAQIGNYAFLGNGNKGVAIYDVSSLSTPVYICSMLIPETFDIYKVIGTDDGLVIGDYPANQSSGSPQYIAPKYVVLDAVNTSDVYNILNTNMQAMRKELSQTDNIVGEVTDCFDNIGKPVSISLFEDEASTTSKGITYSVADDVVDLSGTCTGTLSIWTAEKIPHGTYTLSWDNVVIRTGTKLNNCNVQYSANKSDMTLIAGNFATSGFKTFTMPEDSYIRIAVFKNNTEDGSLRLWLDEGDTPHSYNKESTKLKPEVLPSEGTPYVLTSDLIRALSANVLYGKKWCVCGDSFSAGDFTGYVDPEGHSGTESDAYDPVMGMYKTYPWWIAKRNDMSLAMLAKNGTRFTNISGASGVFSKPTSTVNYTQIPADADYVTIWYGLNETGLTAEQIGTKADTTNETLWGAYNVVFSSILDNNPLAKIGVFISDGELFDGIPQAYHDALIDICKYWAIPYLDLRNGLNVPMGLGRLDECSQASRRKRKEAFQVYSQNIHPGVNGHKYRSTFIENFLRSL